MFIYIFSSAFLREYEALNHHEHRLFRAGYRYSPYQLVAPSDLMHSPQATNDFSGLDIGVEIVFLCLCDVVKFLCILGVIFGP